MVDTMPATPATRIAAASQHELVACIEQKALEHLGRFFGYRSNFSAFAEHVADRKNLAFVDRAEAEARDDIKQLISYILLEDHSGNILTYRRGAYSTSARFLKGSYCIGFGGHVIEEDVQSLFGYRDGGLVSCALREIGEELKGLSPRDLRLIGVINDDSSPNGLRHFAFVFRAQLPRSFQLSEQRHEWAVGDLSLLTTTELWFRYHELEFWSQLLVQHLFDVPKDFTGVYFSQTNRNKSRHPIVIVGEIASGKTEVANYLTETHSLPSISTR